ncbi:MAG: hypothetical protein FWG67_03210 [Defluviitaleaceae bacterium]|nr:hypothetical protein [Defluviitaleaceae bacterium]
MNQNITLVGSIISSFGAIFAIILGIVNARNSKKDKAEQRQWELEKEQIRQKEIDRQEEHTRNSKRVSLMPRFNLMLNEQMSTKNIFRHTENIIIPLSLVNISKDTATAVGLECMIPNGGSENYFLTSGLEKNIHFIHDYLDKNYAFSKEILKMSATCEMHDEAYDVFFKLRFEDLVGRLYEQKFRFQYCYKISMELSLNTTSFPPICIKDKDDTGNSG